MVVPEPEVDCALDTEARPVARARKARLLKEEDMMIVCFHNIATRCSWREALWTEERR